MWQFVVFLILQAAVLCKIGPDFSYYHKTDEINNELQELTKGCDGMLSLTLIQEDPEIYAVDIENKQVPSDSLQKSLFIFGEHARELISAETGLHLLRQLCGTEKNPNVNIPQILQKNKFRLVLNSNPQSRKLVEEGSYCKRTNENNVDLNRNWDAHWAKEHRDSEENPGPSPFSEPETKALKSTFEEYKPDIFLTIHSGTLGMYTPYAYFEGDAVRNGENMQSILSQLNPKYCDCDTGSAAIALHQACKGTCMDYAYEHEAAYAFAFEIYSSYKFVPGWDAGSSSFLHINQKSKRLRGNSNKILTPSCFVQSSSSSNAELSNEQCFTYFNPVSQEKYNFVVDNWTTAILELVQLVNEKNSSS